MASPQAALKFGSRNKINMFGVDGNYTTAAIAKAVSMADAEVWLDMKGYSGVWVGVVGTIDYPTVVSIVADAAADGSDGNVVIATSADAAGTAEGGWMQVEATAEQIVQEGEDNSKNLRYIAVKLTSNGAGDEHGVAVIRYGPRHGHRTLTAGSATNTPIT